MHTIDECVNDNHNLYRHFIVSWSVNLCLQLLILCKVVYYQNQMRNPICIDFAIKNNEDLMWKGENRCIYYFKCLLSSGSYFMVTGTLSGRPSVHVSYNVGITIPRELRFLESYDSSS